MQSGDEHSSNHGANQQPEIDKTPHRAPGVSACEETSSPERRIIRAWRILPVRWVGARELSAFAEWAERGFRAGPASN
jgi:hypothetical protein